MPRQQPASSTRSVVERKFYERPSVTLAPKLLNKLLARRNENGDVTVSGRIVEVEAYMGGDDPASHAFKGPTKRNEVMFGPGGFMYVYFTYGMHWCANLVCAEEGIGQAVLLRALAPVDGIDLIRTARGAAARSSARGGERTIGDKELLSGPARLCQGLGITGDDDGADLVGGDRGLVLIDDGVKPPSKPGISGRVGIRKATDRPWRFYIEGDPFVSRGRPGPPS